MAFTVNSEAVLMILNVIAVRPDLSKARHTVTISLGC